MARGRPPKPTTLNWLNGDPGKRARYKTEPTPPSGSPEKPAHLDDYGSAEWDRTIESLADMQLLSKTDAAALTLYCEAWSRYRHACDAVKKYGAVLVSSSKYMYASPYVAERDKAEKVCRSYLIEFGLTPSGRARLSLPIKEQAKSAGIFKLIA